MLAAPNTQPLVQISSMRSFDEHFSEDAIIWELCRARIQLAATRHDAAFFHNIARSATPAHKVQPKGWGAVPLDIFPSRRQWHRFRPKHRKASQGSDTNCRSLYRATKELRKTSPKAVWAVKLQETVDRVRNRVLSVKPFHFRPPTIIAELKEPGGHLYRPLTVYPLEDKIIEGLTARYLRTSLDHLLLESCLAFRCRTVGRPPPATHDALASILEVRSRHPNATLYVAECDIKGFYDCVAHAVAKRALRNLMAEARPAVQIQVRAIEIFEAYLQSYTFLRSVRGKAQGELRERDPAGEFKWPEADIQKLHGGKTLASIGVPQGGALSCFIANAVLHEADRRIARIQQKAASELLYLRYVDDMILISPDRKICAQAFSVYNQALEELLLPAPPAKRILKYSRCFWDVKSKSQYAWSKSNIPWIQFVGYQIRYDGVVRIRSKSMRKHIAAITKLTDRLLFALRNAHKKQGIRRSDREILHRFRQRLISMSVGRVRLGKINHGPMPMSWAAGFRGLHGRSIFRNRLKTLDCHRERQIMRVARLVRGMKLPAPSKNRKTTVDAHRYYGKPFSYCAQFSFGKRQPSVPLTKSG